MALYGHRRLLNHLSPLPPLTTTKHDSNLLHLHYTEFEDKNFQIKNQTLFYIFILLALTLLITLLVLCTRWFFRFRHLPTTSSSSALGHVGPTCTKGLDESVIKAMPILLHQGSDVDSERDDEVECCICLGVFEDGDKVKVLTECQHRFHSDCVDRWLSGQATCPLCRVSLRPQHSPLNLELSAEI